MSTVLVVGASRGIGLETVKLALKAGHSVRAMARSANAIRLHDPSLEKQDGDALDQHTIERALVGVDAVIQTLGVSPTPELIFGGTRLFSVAAMGSSWHLKTHRRLLERDCGPKLRLWGSIAQPVVLTAALSRDCPRRSFGQPVSTGVL